MKLTMEAAEQILMRRGLQPGGVVQAFIDRRCVELAEPYVPYDTGRLCQSARNDTQFGSGTVLYNTPYARVQYYTNRGGEGRRGAHWFARMKTDHREALLESVRRMIFGR